MPTLSSVSVLDPTGYSPVQANGHPSWGIRRVGYTVMVETDFQGQATFPNGKWGILASTTGTVAKDTSVFWGGAGCAKLLTANAINNGIELKTNIEPVCRPGDYLAFEQKWAHSVAQSSAKYQVGLEARSRTTVLQARFQWTSATGQWQYESAADVYTTLQGVNGSSAPACNIDSPALNATAGTPISWTRIVVDPYKQQYVSFEAPIYDANGLGYPYLYDMRGMPLTSNGVATRALYLPFVYGWSGNPAAAEPFYTFDWVVSVIPAGTVPW